MKKIMFFLLILAVMVTATAWSDDLSGTPVITPNDARPQAAASKPAVPRETRGGNEEATKYYFLHVKGKGSASPRSAQNLVNKQCIRNNYFRIAAQQVDLDRLAREQRNGKPIRLDDVHSAQALINCDQAWVDKQGNLHLRHSANQADLQAADRRLPVVLQQSVRVNRQNIEKLARRTNANSAVAWIALILAITGILLTFFRWFGERQVAGPSGMGGGRR